MNVRRNLVVPMAIMLGAMAYAKEGASGQDPAGPFDTPPIAPAGSARPQPVAAIAGGDVIVCVPNVQLPHNSKHVPGTINVVTTVACTKPVKSLAVRTGLYRNRKRVKISGTRYFPGSRFGVNNAAMRCRPGTYSGAVSWTVRFPPRYVPSVQTKLAWGNMRKLTC
jgi:hypothetical protein